MTIVVADASPLNYLILPRLYGRKCPQEWGHGSLKGRSTHEKSPSFARIGRLKPAPPRMGFQRVEL